MIGYHVTTKKKIMKYIKNGRTDAPIRAWKTIQEAERFSKQTGRRIIVRLKLPDNTSNLFGHKGMAVQFDYPCETKEW